MKRVRLFLFLIFAIMVLAIAAPWLVNSPPPVALPPLPDPNGYDDFIQAGKMRIGELDDLRTATEDELRSYVMTNTASLKLMRVGLRRECRVPLDFRLTNATTGIHATLKLLVVLLAAEGRFAELEKRPADAAVSYADAVTFGSRIAKGGTMIDHLVGVGCQAIGGDSLGKIADKLTQEQLLAFASRVEEADISGMSWDESQKITKSHEQRSSSNPIRQAWNWWKFRPSKQLAKQRVHIQEARLRMLAAEFALRCHRSEKGHPPERLEQLVPKYLQRVPSDPFSGQPLIYRTQGTNWLLYSVGTDGVDDNGKPVVRSRSGSGAKGDMFFDSPR